MGIHPKYPPVRPAPCPVCGKTPKEIWDRFPTGGFVKLRCKPWFRKAHLEVECGAAADWWAYRKAVKAWNEKVWEAKNGKTAKPTEEQGETVMEITQEEEEVRERIVKTACKKWREKLSVLAEATRYTPIGDKNCDPLVGDDDKSRQYRRFKTHVGRMLRWIRDNRRERRCELESQGLRVVKSEHKQTVSGYDLRLVIAFEGSDISPQTFSWEYLWGDDIANLPDRPELKSCLDSQQTMEHVVSTLKRIDMYIELAVRYSAVRNSITDAEVAESHDRVNKSLHQLELLEKL